MFYKEIISLLMFLSIAASDTIKKPQFNLIQKDDIIEIREYPEYVIAKTSISSSKNQLNNNMFRVLASYIFGGNSENKSIPMTSPVITTENDKHYEMIFFMLDVESPNELPKPNNTNVKIESLNIGKTISITFGMWATQERIKYFKDILDSYVEKNNIIKKSPLMIAQYNSPWALPPFRKNELLYTIK
jgi:hypothetical protein